MNFGGGNAGSPQSYSPALLFAGYSGTRYFVQGGAFVAISREHNSSLTSFRLGYFASLGFGHIARLTRSGCQTPTGTHPSFTDSDPLTDHSKTTQQTIKSSTLSRSRRPAHSVVDISAEDITDDDGIIVVSRPPSTPLNNPTPSPSRAATGVFRETNPPISNLQRYSTIRRSILSPPGASLSDYLKL